MSSVGLLDVNVLIALLVTSHIHHSTAERWLHSQGTVNGWATCPVTELSTVRVCALTPEYRVTPAITALLIRQLRRRAPKHRWWTESPSDLPEVWTTPLVKVKDQLTDNYLLGLARQQGGRLITFDPNLAAVGRDDVQCLLPTHDIPPPASS